MIDSIDSWISETDTALDRMSRGCNALSTALGLYSAVEHTLHIEDLQGAAGLEAGGLALVEVSLGTGPLAPFVAGAGTIMLVGGYVKGGLWSARLAAELSGQSNAHTLDAPISGITSAESGAGKLVAGVKKFAPEMKVPKTTFQNLPTGSKNDRAKQVVDTACAKLDQFQRGFKQAVQDSKTNKLPPRCESPFPIRKLESSNKAPGFSPVERSLNSPQGGENKGSGKVDGGRH